MILPQTTIRYTTDNLGVVGDTAFVNSGELGRYLGPSPDQGWHLTEPAAHPGKVCPVHDGMFEVAA